jgi:hypothetical protein
VDPVYVRDPKILSDRSVVVITEGEGHEKLRHQQASMFAVPVEENRWEKGSQKYLHYPRKGLHDSIREGGVPW